MKFFSKKKESSESKKPLRSPKKASRSRGKEVTIYNKGDIIFNHLNSAPPLHIQQTQRVDIVKNEDGIGNLLKNIFNCFKK